MEAALRRMVEENRNVLLYTRHHCINPIRFRYREVEDLPIYTCQPWTPFGQTAIDQWEAKGGVLIYRPHPAPKKDARPPCDAMLLIECPLQMNTFEQVTSGVRQEVVVYRPPTWRLHNDTIETLYPSKDTYVLLDAVFKSMVGRELTEEQDSAAAMSGIARHHAAVFIAWEIEQLAGWNERYLRYAMSYKYRHKSSRFHVYSTRIPPQDENLRWAYDILISQPEVSKGMYTLRFNFPLGGRINKFESMLKQLVRQCYVVKEDSIYVVDTSATQLDYERIDAINNMHRGRWFKVKSLVDASQEYDYV